MGGKLQCNVHDGDLFLVFGSLCLGMMKRAVLGTRLGVWVGLDTNLLILRLDVHIAIIMIDLCVYITRPFMK
jgi:hypothetical protein